MLAQDYADGLSASAIRPIRDATHTQAGWNADALAPHGVLSGMVFAALDCASWGVRNAWQRSSEWDRSSRVFGGFDPERTLAKDSTERPQPGRSPVVNSFVELPASADQPSGESFVRSEP